MNTVKKTLKPTNNYKTKHLSQNIGRIRGKNKTMTKKELESQNEKCNIRLMPPSISDADIDALFSGLVGIVKRKIELETRAEIINLNLSHDKLLKELKNKQAECNRLKNEIIFLKSQLSSNN